MLKKNFKSLNEGKQTKKTRLKKTVAICRGSLAWLGRQTHNLESHRAKRLNPEVAGSNPAPGTNNFLSILTSMRFGFAITFEHKIYIDSGIVVLLDERWKLSLFQKNTKL